MKNDVKRLSLCLFLMACVSACENLDLAREEEGQEEERGLLCVPVSTGFGTPLSPFTVRDFLAQDTLKSEVCVVGYVVGSTYMKWANATFDSLTTNKTNILLSDNRYGSSLQDTACMPVELSGTALQKQFSLAYFPSGFRQCVVFRGTKGQYFHRDALKNVKEGKWLPDLDAASLPEAGPILWDSIVDVR